MPFHVDYSTIPGEILDKIFIKSFIKTLTKQTKQNKPLKQTSNTNL